MLALRDRHDLPTGRSAESERGGTERSPGRRRGRWSVAMMIPLAAVIGCTSTESGTPLPALTSASPPTPTAPALPSAADGSDLAACQDGVCEVRVGGPASLPLDPRYGLSDLRVESIVADSATIAAEVTRAGSARTDCVEEEPDCAGSLSLMGASETAPPTVRVESSTGYRLLLPALTVDAVAVGQGAAVLRLARPDAVDGTDLGACLDGNVCGARHRTVGDPAGSPVRDRRGHPGAVDQRGRRRPVRRTGR